MADYLLDTNILIHVFRGHAKAISSLKGILGEGHTVATCGVVIGEVYAGMRDRDAEVTRRLIGSLNYLEISPAVAMRAGLMKRDFSAKGITLSLADCLIASVCMENGVILVTENLKDFPAAGLQVRGI